jgi:hypothetical protein
MRRNAEVLHPLFVELEHPAVAVFIGLDGQLKDGSGLQSLEVIHHAGFARQHLDLTMPINRHPSPTFTPIGPIDPNRIVVRIQHHEAAQDPSRFLKTHLLHDGIKRDLQFRGQRLLS